MTSLQSHPSHSREASPVSPAELYARTVRVATSAKRWGLTHKWWSAVLLIGFGFIGWYAYGTLTSTAGETRYMLGTAATTTIISTVSASGQVSTSDEINITPKVTGDITWVGVKTGDTVRAGQALFAIDKTDAAQEVVEAEQSLHESRLQYEQDSAEAPIDYQKALDTLETAKDDMETEYNDTFNTLSNTYLDLPAVMTGIQNTLYGYDLSTNKTQWNIEAIPDLFTNQDDKSKVSGFAKIARAEYDTARTKYDKALEAYKTTTRTSSEEKFESLLEQTVEATTDIAQSLQSTLNLLGTAIDVAEQHNVNIPSSITTMRTSVRAHLSTTNSDLSSLLAQKKAITTAKQAVTTSEQNLTLLKVGNASGADPISLQISRNNIASQEINLADLKKKLNDYTVTSPFAGTISAMNAQRGTPASGSSVTVVTTNQVAQLSLNEVDAAKIDLGDKATLTFDAIDELTLTGTVSEIDPVGTVSQGVVSYTIKIAFDSQDNRIKPGMTANASIITDVRQDVLAVPSSAIKTLGGQSYVQIFSPALSIERGATGVTSETLPTQILVITGISDDTSVEILSGLTGGEQVVTRTVTGSTNSSASSAAANTTATGATRSGSGGGATMIRF